MLHKFKVARALWGNAKRQTRVALGRKPKGRVWPDPDIDFVINHHADLLRRFLEALPEDWEIENQTFCEVGCSDCLAIASLLIGKRAAKVELVEPSPPIVNVKQIQILKALQQRGFPLDTTIIQPTHPVQLDASRVIFNNCFMGSLEIKECCHYLCSFDVMEHVEDLNEFYRICARVLKPGGRMFHSIDFSGHDQFEDPLPPLDFQTYPNWLHNLMYPPFHRATRRFLHDHYQALAKEGFTVDQTKVLRRAEPEYLSSVWPQLRPQARSLPPEEVGVLQAVVYSHRE